MRYYDEEYDREDIEQNRQKTTTSKQNNSNKQYNLQSKEDLIDAIMKADPRRDRRVLESFSEFYLKNTLKQILKTQKRGLENTRNKSYVNPFERYDNEQEERIERQGRSF